MGRCGEKLYWRSGSHPLLQLVGVCRGYSKQVAPPTFPQHAPFSCSSPATKLVPPPRRCGKGTLLGSGRVPLSRFRHVLTDNPLVADVPSNRRRTWVACLAPHALASSPVLVGVHTTSCEKNIWSCRPSSGSVTREQTAACLLRGCNCWHRIPRRSGPLSVGVARRRWKRPSAVTGIRSGHMCSAPWQQECQVLYKVLHLPALSASLADA